MSSDGKRRRWATLSLWLVGALMLLFGGQAVANRFEDIEKVNDTQGEALVQVIERDQQVATGDTVPTAAEIVEDVAEQNDIPLDEILPSTLPQSAVTSTDRPQPPTIIENMLDADQIRAIVEPIVLDVCLQSDVCEGPAGPIGSTGDTGSPGSTGAPGLPAPAITDEQLFDMVAFYCSPDNCAGMPGVNGQNGEDGSDGINGEDGEQGIQGIPGQPPTVEEVAQVVVSSCGAGQCFTGDQVNAAMVSYCMSSGTCVGTPGPPGEPGLPGREPVGAVANCVAPLLPGEAFTCPVDQFVYQ